MCAAVHNIHFTVRSAHTTSLLPPPFRAEPRRGREQLSCMSLVERCTIKITARASRHRVLRRDFAATARDAYGILHRTHDVFAHKDNVLRNFVGKLHPIGEFFIILL